MIFGCCLESNLLITTGLSVPGLFLQRLAEVITFAAVNIYQGKGSDVLKWLAVSAVRIGLFRSNLSGNSQHNTIT